MTPSSQETLAPSPRPLGELVARIGEHRLDGDRETVIDEITFDSREVRPGHLFVALRGGDADGHDYIDAALARGAAAVLLDRDCDLPVSRIVVPDARAALSPVAAAFFDDPSHALAVVGITGTDGKTTTAHLVDGLLRDLGVRTGLIGTVAVRIGDHLDLHASRQTTPESVDVQRYLWRMVAAGVRVATIEATSHGLALHRLDDVRFRVGAVTNVTSEHLDYHGTVEDYRAAKGRLFTSVRAAGGMAVINLDDGGARAMLPFSAGARTLTYARADSTADLRAINVVMSASGSSFTLALDGESVPGQLPLVGGFNIDNALAAVGTCVALGHSLEAVAGALARVEPVPGRLARVDLGQPFDVIVDYAHTPESLSKILTLLRGLNPGGRLIVVFGSAGERDVSKRPVQGAVSARLADVSVVTTEDPRHEDPDEIIRQIAAGAAAAGARAGTSLFSITDRMVAVDHAIGLAQPGDTVLLAGKGHEGSIIAGTTKHSWDERGAAELALRRRGWGAIDG
ncbi:MAG: UDP-N-acetylmuramoyl-L-alanyl-D-glutamate--2,6-diaminopimelate ligase [Chloroflexota bacterium]|nr:UDP-N-acetylmuramoyl-L-alanyl-D-glutamate--2,6-diaminopimelate ligase [Chloroflexota bacterium]